MCGEAVQHVAHSARKATRYVQPADVAGHQAEGTHAAMVLAAVVAAAEAAWNREQGQPNVQPTARAWHWLTHVTHQQLLLRTLAEKVKSMCP